MRHYSLSQGSVRTGLPQSGRRPRGGFLSQRKVKMRIHACGGRVVRVCACHVSTSTCSLHAMQTALHCNTSSRRARYTTKKETVPFTIIKHSFFFNYLRYEGRGNGVGEFPSSITGMHETETTREPA